MQRVWTILFIIIFPVFLFSGEQNGYLKQSDLREFHTVSPLILQSGSPVHPALSSIRYAFYPPRKEEALYIRLATDSPSELSLVFSASRDELSLRLPASAEEGLVEILLGEAAPLKALVLPPGVQFYFKKPWDDLLTGRISLESPDELVLTLPGLAASEDAAAVDKPEAAEDLVLTLTNPEPLRISDGSEYETVLRSHNRSRTFHFPLVRNSEWTIFPLSGLESLSLDIKKRPDFPIPLEREGMQILNADPESWRNRDFEIYRWSSVPEVLIFDFRDYDVQNRFLRRLAFFVEKKGYRGQILSSEELKGKHAWNAHDYRASDLAAFFNKTEELDTKLYDEEVLLKDLLIREGILIRSGDILSEGVGAINSIALESGSILRYRFFTHEASHGIYFTQKEYREFVKSFWESLNDEDRDLWRLYLGWYGYDPEDEDLMMNEFQAYFTQQPVTEAAAYFMPRMARMAKINPSLGALFTKKEENAPELFRSWAERIETFQRDNWGLEAGNFSPLQAEWPGKNE